MFDEHDHRTLGELERQLCEQDPRFVNRFRSRQAQLGVSRRRSRGDHRAVGVALGSGVILLALGAPAAAMAAVAATALAWILWRHRHGVFAPR